MSKKIKLEINKMELLDMDKFNRSPLSVEEMRYMLELLDKAKLKYDEYQELKHFCSVITETEDPVLKINYIDDFFQRLERAAGSSNDELRISIISKLDKFDIDFKKYFGI